MYFHALKSSTSLNEEEKKALLVEFNEDIYQSVLDDTAHFIKVHENNIEKVHTEWTEHYGLPKCSVSECPHTARHYGRERREKKFEGERQDELYAFYESLFDRVIPIIWTLCFSDNLSNRASVNVIPSCSQLTIHRAHE